MYIKVISSASLSTTQNLGRPLSMAIVKSDQVVKLQCNSALGSDTALRFPDNCCLIKSSSFLLKIRFLVLRIMGMGGRQRKPAFESVIPQYLVHFEESDIVRMWDFMEDRYAMSKKWRQRYYFELQQTPKSLAILEFFFQFMIERINPILIQLRYSSSGDMIVFKIAKHLIQDRIDEKIKESNFERNYYRQAIANERRKGRL